jgi:sugar-specific transcriptional regulator TrmB
MLDLTPFGFTPTESHAFRALLELGPSSGYAVAKALTIARANAYQALDGLVAKGAAVIAGDESPRRYRAIHPRTLFAQLVDVETRKLDRLERQVMEQPPGGADPVVPIRGERALSDLVVRAIIRTEGEVQCVASGDRLAAWVPAFRARVAAGRALSLWVTDGDAPEVSAPTRLLPTDRIREMLGEDVLLLVADGVLVARLGSAAEGVWSESPLLASLVSAAILEMARA